MSSRASRASRASRHIRKTSTCQTLPPDERSHAFAHPDLTTFCRLDEFGLVVTGQRLEINRAVLACRVVEPDDSDHPDRWCRRCGCEGSPRDTVTRQLAHEPFGWRPGLLHKLVTG